MGCESSKSLVKSFEDESVFDKYKDKVNVSHLRVAVKNSDIHPIVVLRLLNAGVKVDSTVWTSITFDYSCCIEKAKLLLQYSNGVDYSGDLITNFCSKSYFSTIFKMMLDAPTFTGSLDYYLLTITKNYEQYFVKSGVYSYDDRCSSIYNVIETLRLSNENTKAFPI